MHLVIWFRSYEIVKSAIQYSLLNTNSLSFTNLQNFILNQIESICRRQIKCCLNGEIYNWRNRKQYVKAKNAGYQHFSFSPDTFKYFVSKG